MSEPRITLGHTVQYYTVRFPDGASGQIETSTHPERVGVRFKAVRYFAPNGQTFSAILFSVTTQEGAMAALLETRRQADDFLNGITMGVNRTIRIEE